MTSPDHSESASFHPEAVARARKLLVEKKAAVPELAGLYKLLASPVRLKVLLILSRIEKIWNMKIDR